MEHDTQEHSRERVRVLADAVGLPLDEERIEPLALALDAALETLETLAPQADAGGYPAPDGFDPAWSRERAR